MMMGEVVATFGADISGFMQGIQEMSRAGVAFGIALAGVLLVLGGLGIALAASTRFAGDYQQGLTRLKTGAGDVTDNMRVMGQGIMAVSVATGVLTNGTDGLTAAMYLVISAHQRGAQALDTLRVAAQGAQLEQAKMGDVTQILTTIQTDFGIKAHTAAQYMDGLIAAVKNGKITLEDLSTAMSPILPMAKELGIHFADVAAAMSEMTNAGIPADQAATSLRFTMQSMILPTKASQKAMLEWGLDTAAVAKEMKISLPGAIQMYIDAAKRAGPEGSQPFIDALSQMMGGGQRAAKALFALSQNMGEWKSIIGDVSTALNTNATDISGWSDVLGNVNIQADRGRAALADLGIVIGNQLLPYVSQFLGWLTPLIGQFSAWIDSSQIVKRSIDALGAGIMNTVSFMQQMVADGQAVVQFFQQNQLAADALGVAIGILGGVITLFAVSSMADMILSLMEFGLSILTAVAESVTGAAVMSGTFTTMAGLIVGAMGTASLSILSILGPFVLVGAGIALAVIGIELAVQHWADITAWFQGVWSGFMDFLSHTWGVIASVSSILLVFFAPALIMAGTEALIAGVKIIAGFVGPLIIAGATAIASGIEIAVNFVGAMVDAGIAAVASSGKLWVFIGGMFTAGTEGWVAAAGIFATLPALIATGAQAVATGIAFGVDFAMGILTAGLEAFAMASALDVGLIPALYAAGVAMFAALGPLGLLLGLIAAVTAAFIWMKSVTDATGGAIGVMTDSMGNKVEASTGRIIHSTENMKTGVTSATDQMKASVDNAMSQMSSISMNSVSSLSSGAIALMQKMGVDVTAAMQNMSQNTIRSWNNLAADFTAQANQMVVKGNTTMGTLGYNTRQHFTQMAADSHQTVGQMATDVPAQFTTMDTNVQSSMNSLGSNISTAFDKTRTDASSKVQAMSTDITAKFTTIANNGKTQFSNLASNIATGLRTAQSSMLSISSQMVATLQSAWANAAAQAYTGGINIGGNLAGGLYSQVGLVASAAQALANAVASNMPHSPAKEGPLRDLNKFGPALAHGFAAGIIRGTPEVQAAVNMMVRPVAGAMGAPGGGQRSTPAVRSSDGGLREIVINMDQQSLIRALAPALASELRIILQGGV